MPSLVATTSTPARKPFVRTHYVRTNYEQEHWVTDCSLAENINYLIVKTLRTKLVAIAFIYKKYIYKIC